MTIRRFNDIEYPVPGVDTAVQTLRPGAKYVLTHGVGFDEWDDPEGREPPTWDEIHAEVEREEEIYYYYSYEREREKAYPIGEEQLDMLYHDIKNGNFQNGSFVNALEKVKREFPKPEGPPPS